MGLENKQGDGINLKDSVECIKIALRNKPDKGSLNIYNQFTEQFSVQQLAELVRDAMSDIKIDVQIKKMRNPRIESKIIIIMLNILILLN